jgi:biotin carboxyl carrier protein
MARTASYLVTRGREETLVRVTADADRFMVRMGARALEVDFRPTGQGSYSLLVEGRSYEVDVEAGEDGLTVFVGGEPHPLTIAEERTARLRATVGKGKAQTGRRTITAPMPGKVVKHLVKVGDKVEAGQGVIVVEAMKMQNELKSPGPGTVREVRAPEGAVVSGGAPLVVIE